MTVIENMRERAIEAAGRWTRMSFAIESVTFRRVTRVAGRLGAEFDVNFTGREGRPGHCVITVMHLER